MAATRLQRERDDRLALIPWISRTSSPRSEQRCDGIKWREVPLKHVVDGIPERARCKLRAKWRFTALRRKNQMLAGTSGDYCLHHLFSQIIDHSDELERYQKWVHDHPEIYPPDR